MVRRRTILLACTFGLLSGLNFGDYATRKIDSYEAQLLRGTASYVRQYGGEKPKEVLDYAKRTLEITKNFQPEKIAALEEKISEISSEIGEAPSKNVYKPVLKDVGERIEQVSNKRAKKVMNLIAGGLCALAAIKK